MDRIIRMRLATYGRKGGIAGLRGVIVRYDVSM